MEQIQYLSVLDDPEENKKVLKELPSYIVNRWSRIVDKSTNDDPEEGPDEQSVESTVNLGTCLTLYCHPIINQQNLKSEGTTNFNKKRSTKSDGAGTRCLATGRYENQQGRQTNEQRAVGPKPKYIYCTEEH